MANTRYVNFGTGTSEAYASIVKDPNTLYFLTDTRQIMKGDQDYTSSIFLVDSLPSNPARGKFYIVGNKAYTYQIVDGTGKWITVYDLQKFEDGFEELQKEIERLHLSTDHLVYDSVEDAKTDLNNSIAPKVFPGRRISINQNGTYLSYVVQQLVDGSYTVEPLESGNLMTWTDIE